MPASRGDLIAFLDRLGIATRSFEHPPLFTVEQSRALRGDLGGGHSKNLFLKDKKDNYFLLTVGEAAQVDLKQVHHAIGAASRVSFGRPEMLMELLGVIPGAVTVFGLINDTGRRVKPFLDATLMEHETINAHPLTNEATTQISRVDLLRFLAATGHEPTILKLTA